MILSIYASLIVLAWLAVCALLLANTRKITYLRTVPTNDNAAAPAVAVIIAVKDEEAELETALQSVCALRYPAFRIIVVNDRSTDGTGAILARMAQRDPRLTVINVDELPAGWLGKNHALYKGYCASTEEWLLFTDGDVQFAPDTLRKAMAFVQERGLQHLTVLPEVTSRSGLFRAVMNTFALMLDIKLQPWTVSDPKSKSSIGVGAFNLVERAAYERAGTHLLISLRPDDDLKLGARIKGSGGRQDVAYGESVLWLEWYHSLGQFVNGLMKNMYSVYDYQLAPALGAAVATFLILVLPVPLLLLSGVPYIYGGLLIFAAQVALMLGKKGIRAPWWHALLMPFAGLVMVYVILKSTWRTVRQGGIYWRDSFYPLSELRKQVG
ncbi:MAG: glycosyltransferase [Chitinophagaceae bacterium]|nr:MAG: glycosyltransferase [Chitinophagaceae bacterium]